MMSCFLRNLAISVKAPLNDRCMRLPVLNLYKIYNIPKFLLYNLQYMTDGVLLRETLKDSDLDKYRYGNV